MKTDYSQLIALQEKDVRIDVINIDLEELPQEIEELSNQLAEAHQSFDTFKTEIKQAGLQQKEKEGDLTAKEKEIAKFTGELNSIKTNDAYKAMLTQIETAKQAKSRIEDEILELLEQGESGNTLLKEEEKKLKEFENEGNGKINKIKDRIHALESELKQLEQDRSNAVSGIENSILQRYDHIRRGKDGMALVPIKDSSCSGCNYTLPPQIVNEAAKGKDIIICENCSRIVYYVPATPEPT